MADAAPPGTISVVIPSFNHGRYLRSTLASAFDQTLPPDEVVVVDDGSSDDSPEILAGCGDARLHFVAQENRGAHAAINRAIELSRGDYVAILNSDDLFEPERLEHAWGVARAAGALLVCGEVQLIGDDGGPAPAGHDIVRWYEEARRLGREAPSLAAALRRHNVAVTTSNFFVHRELWQRLGGFREWRYVHDYDFLLRAVALCPDRVVYEPSLRDVRYRVHGANTISESHHRALEERARMIRSVRSPRVRLRSLARRVTESSALGRAASGVGVPAPVRTGTAIDARSRTAGSPASGEGRAAVGEGRATVGIVVRSLGLGGLEEIVALLARALPVAGADVAVHCLERGGAVADRLTAAGVNVSIGDGTPAGCAAWVRASGVDIVSGHHLPLAVTQSLATLGLPVIETLHNTFAWYGPDDWAEERERVELITDAVAVSETVAAYYQRHTRYRPAHIVPNAVHPGRVTAVPRSFARRLLGVAGEGPVFVSVGRLAQQKNLPGLLAAFARLQREHPAARLLLAGPKDPSVSLATLRRTHSAIFASGAVRWLETRRDVGTVLSAADAYVSAAFYEGWSVAASEAAWVGLPLLLSDVGGAAELVGSASGPGDGPRGRVVVHPCGDPLGVDDAAIAMQEDEARATHEVELADAMTMIAADLHGWRARGGEIRAWARTALAPITFAARYVEVLEGALERRR